jgi:hypothetical protein
MALEKEVETYKRELPSLLKDEGKFVVIHENEVEGSYDTYDDALKVGYDKFGLKDFLVKKIEATERVLFFAGDLYAI